jgi:Icc-related predicted phosphoesterase
MICFFVTDLHGDYHRYTRLMAAVVSERPQAVFFGGDLLPHQWGNRTAVDFISEYLLPLFRTARERLGKDYPAVFLIPGNDDARCEEPGLLHPEHEGLWTYMHAKKASFLDLKIYGYAYVPPSPFLLKDWERYDVSRYVSPGCVSPEEGHRTVAVPEHEIKWATIQNDLNQLVGDDPLDHAICLFHTPPHQTPLDRAALDGRMFDHVPLDLHVGSIAVRRFIEQRQPLLTLHGHIHESARITGHWKFQIGRTVCINAAHDGIELSLVRFDPAAPEKASRELL